MINSPRFARTCKLAFMFCVRNGVNKLPVNLMTIILKSSNWKILTYDAFAAKHGISIEDVIEWADSVDGCVQYWAEKNKYLIMYNDNPKYIDVPQRINWTLAHEIGHIYLGHLQDFKEARISRNALTEKLYYVLEKEANFFAASILAPNIILDCIKVRGHRDIMNICKLSKQAAINRVKSLTTWKTRKTRSPEETGLLILFKDFIDQKKCSRCGFGFINTEAKYCPICGRELEWGEKEVFYNDGYELDENGRALKCPRCGNEEIQYEDMGDYCIICGAYLVNKCSPQFGDGCGTIAPGNARHCLKCGGTTTFFNQEFLTYWGDAQKKIKDEIAKHKKEAAAAVEQPDFEDLPF